MKLNLDTIIIFVGNIERLKSFYIDILNLEILEELPSEWLLLKAGNCNIGLHKTGDQYPGKNKDEFKSESNTKLVFQVDDDIYKIREELLSKKVTLKEVKTFDNYDYLVCDGEDPEGNVFQLKQKK